MNRNRLSVPTLVLCSTLALVASAPGSRTADAATVLEPATDDGRPSPSPSPPPIDVVVSPSICFECGGAGPICCAPEHQCFVLDTIVLAALRKEPEQRYGSVEALADDLRRHLDDLPVRARGDRLG